MSQLNYVELPSGSHPATKAFYVTAFGFKLVDYGSTYSCTVDSATNIGLQGNAVAASAAPLPVILVTDLEATFAAIENAGGTITKPIFNFPGGRRFHFTDPSGNELAAWVQTEE